MKKFIWYYYRLKAMSIPEVFYRIQNKFFRDKKQSLIIAEDYVFKKLGLINLNIQYKPINVLTIFNKVLPFDYSEWDNSINRNYYWNDKDESIDYKHNKNFDEVRYVWELNRLQHMPILFLTDFQTNNDNVQSIKIIQNWIEENPYKKGINWTSSMEVAIRSINLILCFDILNSVESGVDIEFINSLKRTIIEHVTHVDENLSLFSSANNHLIVEALALLFAGIAFEETNWLNKGKNILEKEITRQTFSDGVNKEQSYHYQAFVMEAYLLAIHLMRKKSVEYKKTIDKYTIEMCGFIDIVRNFKNRVPNIGDSDDGRIINISYVNEDHYEFVLQFASILFDERYSDFENVGKNLQSFFGEVEIQSAREKKRFNNNTSKIFEKGGYTKLSSRDNMILDLLIDHGDLGFGTIAAHGHADALSITLSLNGDEILVDPGTYIYNIEEEWRDYFRKTINHNCLAVKGNDQSQMLGSFLWGNRAKSKLIDYSLTGDIEYVVAEHNGYKSTIHRRKVEVDKLKKKISIQDTLTKPSEWIINYTVHPDCVVCETEYLNTLLISKNGQNFKMVCEEGLKLEIIESWYSRMFGVKVPTKSIRIYGDGTSHNTLIFME